MTKRKVKKAIAIVGEGITEWMYFDYIRRNRRYAFSLKPDLPKHSHYSHIFKKAKELIQKGYDIVFCVLDLDAIQHAIYIMEAFRRHLDVSRCSFSEVHLVLQQLEQCKQCKHCKMNKQCLTCLEQVQVVFS